MAPKHETDEKRIPGTVPDAQLKPPVEEQRYGPTEGAVPPANTAAPGSTIQIVRDELRAMLAELGIGKTPEQEQAKATRQSLNEQSARLRRIEERQANAVVYRALGPVWVDSIGGMGGHYVKAGETFASDKPPGRLWEPTDEEGRRRKEEAESDRDLAERAAKINASSVEALDGVKAVLEQAQRVADRAPSNRA
jgi:hypothetical protein